MRTLINVFCLAAILFIFNSCTITRRHFGGGYHVEWNRKWDEKESNPVAKKQDITVDTLFAQATPVTKSDSEKPSSKKESKAVVTGTVSEKELSSVSSEELAIVETVIPDKTTSQDGISSGDETVQEEAIDVASQDDQPKDVAPKKKVEPLTWVAFAFLLVGIGFGLLPMALFSSFTLPLILFFLLFLIAFINAVSSALRVSRNPEKYKAKGFTWFVLVLSSIGFVFALTTLLLYMIKGSMVTFN